MLLRMLTGTQRPLWGTLVVVLVFLVMALLSPLSQAATYYVSTNGNDNSTGTTIAESVQTITQAISLARVSGDEIVILGPDYTFSDYIYYDFEEESNGPPRDLTIRGSTPGDASATVLTCPTCTEAVIFYLATSGTHVITLKDFTINYYNYSGIYSWKCSWNIDNIVSQCSDDSVSGRPLYLPQSQSVSIKNSNFNGKWPAYISAPTGSTNATLVISNSKFGGGRNVESAYMTENGAGGALTIVSFADVKIADSKFSDSASAHTGGCLLARAVRNLTVSRNTFFDCQTQWYGQGSSFGGGLCSTNENKPGPFNVQIEDSQFINCRGVRGSAAYFAPGHTVTMRNTVVRDCDTELYAGIYFDRTGRSLVENCTFDNNLGTNTPHIDGFTVGAAIYSAEAPIDIRGSRFTNNYAYQGGAVYIQSSSGCMPNCPPGFDVSIVDSYFEGNAAGLGGAVAIAGFDTRITATLRNNYFYKNSATSDLMVPSMDTIQGGAVSVTGNSTLFMSNCSFVQNQLLVWEFLQYNGYGTACFFGTSAPNYGTITDCLFEENTGYIDYDDTVDAYGALVIAAVRAQASITRCQFIRNGIPPGNRKSGKYSWGGGLVLSTRGSDLGNEANPSGVRATVVDSLFDGNYAEGGGAVALSWAVAKFRNTTFRNNVAHNLGAVFLAHGNRLIPSTAYLDVQDCSFQNDTATTDYLYGDSYPVLEAETNCIVTWGPNEYRNLTNDKTKLYGYAIRAYNATINFVPRDGEPDGAELTLPATFMCVGGVLKAARVKPTFDKLLLQEDSVAASIPSIGDIGSTHVTITELFSVRGAIVTGTTEGKIITNGEIWTTRGRRFDMSEITLENHGVGLFYPSTISLTNSKIVNNLSGEWYFTDFTPISGLTLNPTSSFINHGYLSIPAANMTGGGSLILEPTSEVNFLLTKYWKPNTVFVESLTLNGKIRLDSSYFSSESQPVPLEQFVIASVTNAPSGFFNEIAQWGGYILDLSDAVDEASGATKLIATVKAFFPSSAQMSAQGTSVSVRFPRATDVPNGPCSNLLEATDMFSADATCIWEAEDTLAIRANRLVPEAELRFKTGSIKSAESPLLAVSNQFSIMIAVPDIPPTLNPIIVGATVISSCTNIILDATPSYGGGAVAKEFVWTLLAAPAEVEPQIEAFLANLPANTARVVIPSTMLSSAPTGTESYSFRLHINTVLNVAGASLNFTVSRKPNAVPIVYLEGPARKNHMVNRPLQLNARITIPNCFDMQSNTISKSWRQVSGPVISSSLILSQLTLQVPEYVLKIGSSYVFEFVVTTTGANPGSSSLQVQIDAIGAPMSLYSTGAGGMVSTAAQLRLAVTLADGNVPPSDPAIYYWEVVQCPLRGTRNTKAGDVNDEAGYLFSQISGSTQDSDPTGPNGSASTGGSNGRPEGLVCQSYSGSQIQLKFNNSDIQTIAPYTLTNGTYIFLVEARRDNRVARALIFINVELPSATNYRFVNIVPELLASKLLPQQKLTLRGLVDGVNSLPERVSVLWSSLEPDAQSLIDQASNVLTRLDNINLVLKPNILTAGRLYRFVLRVLDAQTGNLIGANTLAVVVNTAPFGGVALASPETAFQGDIIAFEAAGWIDDDHPLTYVFSAMLPSGQEIIFSDASEVPRVELAVAIAGDPAKSNKLQIRARVFDSLGAESTDTTTLTVEPRPGLGASALHQLQQAIHIDDYRSAGEAIIMLSTLANFKNESATPLRGEMIAVLRSYVQTHRLTLVNINYLTQQVLLVTGVEGGIDDVVRDGALDVLEACVDAALTSTSSSAFSSADFFAAYATTSLAKTIENIVPHIRSGSQAASSTRVIALLGKIAQINSALLQLEESPASLGSAQIQLLVQKILGSATFTGQSGAIITVNATTPSTVQIIEWTEESFPFSGSHGTVITIQITGQSGQGVAGTPFGVDIPYTGNETPASCGLYDEISGQWRTDTCQMTIVNPTTYRCSCTTPQSGGRAHLGLLFGDFQLEPPISNEPGSEVSSGFPPGGIIAIITVIVIVSAIAVAFGFSYRKHRIKTLQKSQLASALSKQMGDNSFKTSPYTPLAAAVQPDPEDSDSDHAWMRGDTNYVRLENI